MREYINHHTIKFIFQLFFALLNFNYFHFLGKKIDIRITLSKMDCLHYSADDSNKGKIPVYTAMNEPPCHL